MQNTASANSKHWQALNQEWSNVEIEWGKRSPKDRSASDSGAFDLCVVDFGSRQSLAEVVAQRPHAKEKLAEELKKLKREDNDGDFSQDALAPKKIFIPYEGKGGLYAIVVMGDASSFVLQTSLRQAFAEAMTVEGSPRTVQVHLLGLKEEDAKNWVHWIVSLAHLVRFRNEVFGKRSAELKPLGKLTLMIQTGLNRKTAEAAAHEGRVLSLCNNQVRWLADLPSNVLNPETYRDRAQTLAKSLKVDFNFIDQKQLAKRGAGAFLAVVQADHNERAGIVHLKYRAKKSKKKVALVGKGLCFDTGGYNVKTGNYMYNMHRDMTGSAVALSLFRALVELEAPYDVDCYLALAENLISHEGYRPNDVVMASNGMSIEVIDTDAEGRMVLSDTLVLASEGKPDLLIDFATLTGSVVRALDTLRCGSYSNHSALGRLSVEVGDRSGERVWNFPIGGDYQDALKSETADIRQCASATAADHIYAATFLSKFVAKRVPWIHIDLAADTNKGGLGLVPTDTTGFGVRFGYELIQRFL